MAIALDGFWGPNFYKHPPLTDAMVHDAELLLGIKLPTLLLELLRIQNGGYTKGFAHPMERPTTWAADHVPLDDLAGIVTDASIETPMNILNSEAMKAEWGLPPRQILLSGDGHYWITLDYRKRSSPTVAWIDVDSDEDVPIAGSFASFVSGLVPADTFKV